MPTPGFQGYLIVICGFPAHGVLAIGPLDDPLHSSFLPATVLGDAGMPPNLDIPPIKTSEVETPTKKRGRKPKLTKTMDTAKDQQ